MYLFSLALRIKSRKWAKAIVLVKENIGKVCWNWKIQRYSLALDLSLELFTRVLLTSILPYRIVFLTNFLNRDSI